MSTTSMKVALLLSTLFLVAIISFRNAPLKGEQTYTRERLERGGRKQTADSLRFEAPEGFVVEEVYAPEQAGSVQAITFDSQGRLVISRQDSSIYRLFDKDSDGIFDDEQLVTDQVTDAQGMIFKGPTLLAVGNSPPEGDESSGLYRVVDENGDGRGDRVEIITRTVGAMQEHGPHAVFFGPDGYLYWITGNHTGLYPSYAPLSPFRDYSTRVLALLHTDPRGHASDKRVPAGIIVRKDLQTPDSGWELVAGGFRNAYDAAFNLMGELFTFDSDMEWDQNLPWYRPTRSVHVVPGGDYGWRTGSRKLPAYFLDTLPPMQNLGRASPTGVVFYQNYSYPQEYWGALLQGDWSRGRIVMGKLTKDGATYTQESSDFVYGEPLNVTDVVVGPDGNVYFSLGGRGTSGGIYRVDYIGPNAMTRPEANTPIERVLTMPQPRSAYSRRKTREIKAQIGATAWQESLLAVVRDSQAAPERRVRAMELLVVYGPGMDMNTLVPLSEDPSWKVRAATAYYLGMKSGPSVRRAREVLVRLLHDADPFVQRRAAEALIRTGIHPTMEVSFSAVEDVFPLLASEHRFVRYAAKELLRRINRNEWQEAALQLDEYPQAPMALVAYTQTINDPSPYDVERLLEHELELLQARPSGRELLDLVRAIQLTMLKDQGLTFATGGGSDDPEPGLYPQIGEQLLGRFPSADSSLNRAIARTLTYLETPGALDEIVAELNNPQISREQQIFYAYAASNMGTGWDEASIEQMISWFEKVHSERWRGGASFTGYIDYMEEDFMDSLPDTTRVLVAGRMEALEPPEVEPSPGERRPFAVSAEEVEQKLIYAPRSFKGDASKGAEAFVQALCITCHKFGPIGRAYGPNLTTVGQRFTREDLVTAIMHPSETISSQYPSVQITKTNGNILAGMISSENAREVVLQIAAGAQVTIPKSEIQSREVSDVSAMPDGLLHYLSPQQRVNLLLFLEAGPEAIPDSMLSSR